MEVLPSVHHGLVTDAAPALLDVSIRFFERFEYKLAPVPALFGVALGGAAVGWALCKVWVFGTLAHAARVCGGALKLLDADHVLGAGERLGRVIHGNGREELEYENWIAMYC